jgi:alpha-glucosidase (family GH31 glycosyl hydrolase)
MLLPMPRRTTLFFGPTTIQAAAALDRIPVYVERGAEIPGPAGLLKSLARDE